LSFSTSTLLQAVSSGDENAVSAIIASGGDVNAANDGGQTPLILAVIAGHLQMLHPLLKAGANPLLCDKTGLNAIDWAERRGRTDLAQLLSQQLNLSSAPFEAVATKHKPTRDTRELPRSETLSSDEKSRRFLAGLKQRLEEKAELTNTSSLPPEPVQSQKAIENNLINPEEQRTSDRRSGLSNSRRSPEPEELEPRLSSTPSSKPSARKRCPECNRIYNSELLAYCAHHVVPLVDIDEPVIIAKPNNPTPLFWSLLLIMLFAATFVGLRLANYLFKNPLPNNSPAALVTTNTRKGIPVVGRELAGKAVVLPEAEVSSDAVKGPTTVTVRVKIDRAGRVYSALSTNGERSLRESAMAAAKQATFSAAKLGLRGAEGTITYTFKP
jgi:TonB family protein